MGLPRIAQALLPGAAEEDPIFEQEIQYLAHRGLLVVGVIQMVVPAVAFLIHFWFLPEERTLADRAELSAFSMLAGVATLALRRFPLLFRFSRPIAIAVVLTAVGLLVAGSFHSSLEWLFNAQLAIVLFIAVIAIPLLPLQTLGIGAFAVFAYVFAAGRHNQPPDPEILLSTSVLVLLSTALTAVVYSQRHEQHRAHLATLEAANELRETQTRMLLSEYSASLGHIAAAFSHELNSPVGALTSGVDTLLLLSSKQATASSPAETEKLLRLQIDLRRSIQSSAERLKKIVSRFQRFTNLDRAEVQPANVNELLSDVTSLLDPSVEGSARVRLELEPLPPLVCRPQKISAVFYSLLSNAVKATKEGGEILVTSRATDSEIRVGMRDTGTGIAPELLGRIFDPGFRERRGRVAMGNWSMFSARQIVREHGGEIRIASTPGEGTTVTVSLPLANHVG